MTKKNNEKLLMMKKKLTVHIKYMKKRKVNENFNLKLNIQNLSFM